MPWKLFTKGPNFRNRQSLNYSRYKKEIDRAIEEFPGSLRLKHKLGDAAMDLWMKKIKGKVENKKNSPKKSKQILACNA